VVVVADSVDTAAARPERAGNRFAVLPEEWLAIAFTAAVAGLWAWLGWPFTFRPLLWSYVSFVGAITTLALPFWAFGQAYRARRGRFDARAAALDVGSLLRALGAFLVILVAYTNLKSRVFLLHPTLYDRELARLDAWIHFAGGDLLAWILDRTADRDRMDVLGLVYFYAWLGLALPFAVAFARAGGGAARRLLAALGLVYVVGAVAYVAVPAVGPAFFERDRWSHLVGAPTWIVQERMSAQLRAIAADPTNGVVPFSGLAAFPSLHLATIALGLFAAWRWCRPLLVLLVPFDLAVAWSAVVWGWHYAVDFYPGLALAAGAWWLAGRWVSGGPPGSSSGRGAVAPSGAGAPRTSGTSAATAATSKSPH
jgi:hypothetical protein